MGHFSAGLVHIWCTFDPPWLILATRTPPPPPALARAGDHNRAELGAHVQHVSSFDTFECACRVCLSL